VYGHGEGGLIALLCGALEPTIQFTGVSGYLGTGDTVWDAPLYRNLWGFLSQVGDGGLAVLVAPRMLFVRHTEGPKVDGPPPPQPGRAGAAPGRLVGPDRETLKDLKAAIGDTYGGLGAPGRYSATEANLRDRGHWSDFLQLLGLGVGDSMSGTQLQDARKDFDPDVRLKRQFDQLVEHTQRVVRQAEDKRQEFFWTKLNLKTLADYQQSCAPLRQYLLEEVIGKLPPPDRPANPRSRPLHDEPKWRSYEVTLDLYGDVFAQGILCVPKGLKAGERRPVVVCQHGLEGRPTDVVNPKEVTKYYHSFGSALADRGFVVFAPQNPYIFQNHFRQLQRKANPLKLSLFSFIVRQHERILDWLAGLPFVDEKRMGFYGLSYGGKTAMRVPALLDRYCLSICSGDFNEWIWKNTSVDFRGSYLYTNEYEMPEFDLGNTFGYAEMAALIAPRPFMVERGHDDGVGIDEWVAYEYAKVRRLYAKLGIPERTAIEFFNGGHQINSQGTFAFLHKHLNWPAPA
jgi:hypothetical protein